MKLSFRAELAHFAKPSSSRVCWREAPFLCCIRVRQFLKLPRWTTTERTASSYERYLTRNTPCRTESLMPWFFIISSKFFLIPNYLFHFQTRVERSTVHCTRYLRSVQILFPLVFFWDTVFVGFKPTSESFPYCGTRVCWRSCNVTKRTFRRSNARLCSICCELTRTTPSHRKCGENCFMPSAETLRCQSHLRVLWKEWTLEWLY